MAPSSGKIPNGRGLQMSCLLADYSLSCFKYIHNNPVTAGLVHSPDDWEFSSYREYAGMSPGEPICNVKLCKELLSLERNDMFNLSNLEIPTEVSEKYIFKVALNLQLVLKY